MAEPGRVDYARDVSEGGLFVHTGSPPSPGKKVFVQFAPQKDARLVQATCRVARVTPEGMGLEFVELEADLHSLLRRVVSN